jgi:small subunit ribosomal protein S16
MATRIRLQRHGKKGKPVFHIVAADSRAKRDGKFIEKLGTYNPNTNPATIDIDFDRTLNWVQTGAEMSDTARAILHYKGVMYKNHLIKGIAKGALTEEQVEAKFAEWMASKEAKVSGKADGLSKAAIADKAARMKAEEVANAAKAAAVAAKNAPEAVVEEVTEVTEEAVDTATESVEEVTETTTEAVEEVAVAATEEVTETVAEASTETEAPAAEETSSEEETPA